MNGVDMNVNRKMLVYKSSPRKWSRVACHDLSLSQNVKSALFNWGQKLLLCESFVSATNSTAAASVATFPNQVVW
jgi:hypothetical protein